MAWTNKQKQIAVMACRAARISDEQRVDLILRNFERAHYKGKITSTSTKLTHQDFEAFMAIVENFAGGTILHYTPGYWKMHAADRLRLMRARAIRVAAMLEQCGKLNPNGAGLAGWIRTRVSGGETDRVDELDYQGLLTLITGLEAYARQNAVSLAS